MTRPVAERAERAPTSEERVGERIEAMRRRPQRFRDERVTMAHGAGGKASRALVEGLVVPLLANPALNQLSDAGLVSVGTSRLALTTDAFVVRPIRFPGGSIGELAVNGTVNDLAVSGARPVALSAALVLEEGLAADVLEAEVRAIADAARAADVPVVTGDTKVVERGKCDFMYVVTTGVGLVDEGVSRSHPTGCGQATRCWSREPWATTGWPSCWPAATSTSRPTWKVTPSRSGPSRRRFSGRAARGCTACAMPPAVVSRPF